MMSASKYTVHLEVLGRRFWRGSSGLNGECSRVGRSFHDRQI